MTTELGDWVRFQRNGILFIGVVEYRRKLEHWPNKIELVTTCGTLYEDDVLECRRGQVTS